MERFLVMNFHFYCAPANNTIWVFLEMPFSICVPVRRSFFAMEFALNVIVDMSDDFFHNL